MNQKNSSPFGEKKWGSGAKQLDGFDEQEGAAAVKTKHAGGPALVFRWRRPGVQGAASHASTLASLVFQLCEFGEQWAPFAE